MRVTRQHVQTVLGDVFVESVGEGPPVLFLHGVSSSHASFHPQMAALAGEFALLAWDAPGYGESPDVQLPPTLELYAISAANVLSEMGVHAAHVVGASWGAVIATLLALEFPHTVRSLALIGPTPGRAGNTEAIKDVRQRRALLERLGVEAWSANRVERLVSAAAPTHLRDTVRQTMVSSVRVPGFAYATTSLTATDLTNRLGQIRVPTMIIVGVDDVVTGASEAEIFSQRIPDARLAVVAGAGHLTNQEQPAAVNAALRSLWMPEEAIS